MFGSFKIFFRKYLFFENAIYGKGKYFQVFGCIMKIVGGKYFHVFGSILKMLFSYKFFTFSQLFSQHPNKFYYRKFQNIHLTKNQNKNIEQEEGRVRLEGERVTN